MIRSIIRLIPFLRNYPTKPRWSGVGFDDFASTLKSVQGIHSTNIEITEDAVEVYFGIDDTPLALVMISRNNNYYFLRKGNGKNNRSRLISNASAGRQAQ